MNNDGVDLVRAGLQRLVHSVAKRNDLYGAGEEEKKVRAGDVKRERQQGQESAQEREMKHAESHTTHLAATDALVSSEYNPTVAVDDA